MTLVAMTGRTSDLSLRYVTCSYLLWQWEEEGRREEGPPFTSLPLLLLSTLPFSLLSSFPLPPSSPSRVRGVLSQSRCGTTISMVFNMTSGPSVPDPSQWTSSLLSWQKPSPTLLVGTQLCSLHTEGWHSSGEGGGVEEREMVREMVREVGDIGRRW